MSKKIPQLLAWEPVVAPRKQRQVSSGIALCGRGYDSSRNVDGPGYEAGLGDRLNTPCPCNVLMLYPRFAADSFWSFDRSCKLMGVRRPAAPLGLISVAAMLPVSWTVRLAIDCNTASITDDDLAWADVVFTGGMLPQQADTLRLIEVCRSWGKPVVVGGPDPTSIRASTPQPTFRCSGEAEDVIDEFVAAGERLPDRASSQRPNSGPTSPRRQCRVSTCSAFKTIFILACSIRAAARFTCEFSRYHLNFTGGCRGQDDPPDAC